MGLAWRQPSRSRHRQRPRSLTTRDNGDTRPGHIPTPPRPRPDRARPVLPQGLAATFWVAISAVLLGPAAGVVVNPGTFAFRRALKSHDRSHISGCKRYPAYRLAADWTCRRDARSHLARHRLDRAMACVYRHFPRTRPHRCCPPITGSGRASLRTTRRENQGLGSYSAGIDRPVASRSGSIASREAPSRRAAG